MKLGTVCQLRQELLGASVGVNSCRDQHTGSRGVSWQKGISYELKKKNPNPKSFKSLGVLFFLSFLRFTLLTLNCVSMCLYV